jgi:hypothetical protein
LTLTSCGDGYSVVLLRADGSPTDTIRVYDGAAAILEIARGYRKMIEGFER